MDDLLDVATWSDDVARERRSAFPVGARLTLEDVAAVDADDTLDELRRAEPVSWVPALGGWLITSHDLARQLLLPRDDVTVQSRQNMVRASLGRMMLTVDAEDHRRARKPFEVVFRPREVERRFALGLRERAHSLLDTATNGDSFDLVARFALPYALEVAGEVVGLDLSAVERLGEWYGDFAAAMVYDGDPAPLVRADRARDELNAELLVGLDRAVHGSLTSSVREAEENDLTRDELVAELRVIMFGAIETIQASVTNTVLLLARRPDVLESVRRGSLSVDAAVSESLRLIPPVSFIERWARTPLDVGGVAVGEGEFVGVSVLAANHDPSVFDEPHVFNPERENAHRALSFSFGEHHCLGYHLARLQTSIAVEVLLDRLPVLSVDAVDEPSGFAFRRPERLIVSTVAR